MPYIDLPKGDKMFFVQEGKGKPLIFIHGFASTSLVWQKQIEYFKKKNQVIAVDLRGHGKSVARDGYLSLDDFAGDLITLIRKLALKEVRLVGWSMGWFVALKTFLRSPHNVDALVSVSGAPKFLKSESFPYAISHAELRNLEKKIKSHHAEGIDFFYSLISNSVSKEYFVHPSKHLTFHMLRELETADERKALDKIYVRTLLIHGSEDRICLPSASEYMHQHIPASEKVIMPGLGHAPFLEEPDKFNAILEGFLRQLHG